MSLFRVNYLPLLALALPFFALTLIATGTALAQTTPTFGETQVGTACNNFSHSTDFDTLVQCTSTNPTPGTFQKAPLFIGAVTSPPYADTTCDADKKGMLQYDGTEIQYCDGTAWQIIPNKAYVDAAGGEGTWQTQTFTANGTWTKPATTKTVNLLMVGGGGGGGGAYTYSSAYYCGHGGGGGGVMSFYDVPVSGDLVVSVGGGGARGRWDGIYMGGTGGTTSVSGGASRWVIGGTGGGWSAQRNSAGSGGPGGQDGHRAVTTSTTRCLYGAGGNSYGIGGGYTGSSPTYGGGGRGAQTFGSSTEGEAGASGMVIITWQE